MLERKNIIFFAIALCILANIFIWQAVVRAQNAVLTVSFLDVGQGDAIFIRAPGGNQALIDGGPGRAVLRQLSSVMPFYDRTIDVIVSTHPDKDHIGGLPEVLKRFRVGAIVEPGVSADTSFYEEFTARASEEAGAVRVTARAGQTIDLGGGARLVILFPDRDVSGLETNTASIVARLEYGDTAFILTGDSPQSIETYLVSRGAPLNADVLKLGHHGSRTSSADAFVGAVSPEYAIISAGKDNTYGHPHKEVLDTLARFNIPFLGTYEKGTVVIESDGERIRVR